MARLIFAGSPSFAATVLAHLHDSQHEIRLVLSQPDRAHGRSSRPTPGEVTKFARSRGLPLQQPARPADVLTELRHAAADVMVVAAYGHILPSEVLTVCPHGALNVHASLLPAYRGASPVQHAILDGVSSTGATLMKMDEGLDTGPILAQRIVDVAPTDTAGSLSNRLAEAGSRLLVESLPEYLSGSLSPRPQGPPSTPVTRRLTKSDGLIDWRRSADHIERHVRAMHPWPKAFTFAGDVGIQILEVEIVPGETTDPGHFEPAGPLTVQTGQGLIRVNSLRPSGKAVMTGEAFLRGYRGDPCFSNSGG